MSKLITAAQLDGYRRLKDKSISLRFITSEKTSQDIYEVDQLMDQFGYLYFKAEGILTPDEIKELDNLDTELYDKPKTQSQRIRNVLFMLWKQKKIGEFNDFYKQETERVIQYFKNKLDKAILS